MFPLTVCMLELSLSEASDFVYSLENSMTWKLIPATNIGSAYLEATTQVKVSIKTGPEFGELSGHLLIIYKALYGLRFSGKEFGDLLANPHC